MASKLHLRSLFCEEPATSFGDDIEVYANGELKTSQFPIDQGQSHDIGSDTFFNGSAEIKLIEDGDGDTPGIATALDAEAGQGVQKKFISLKDDGKYWVYYEVLSSKVGRRSNIKKKPKQ